MGLKIGIVGLPNVGKSTLFTALTTKKVDIANYPFCTIDPNVGVVLVPDARLYKLANLSNSKKVIPAVVEFVDIAGLVKGAAWGEGLGNKFLSHIKEVDAIGEVVRIFENQEVIHVTGPTNPVSDIEIIEYELILKDLELIYHRLDTTKKDKRGGRKLAAEEIAILTGMKKCLEEGSLLRGQFLKITESESGAESAKASSSIPRASEGHLSRVHPRLGQWSHATTGEFFHQLLKELQPLTAKPIIYIFNISEEQVQNGWQPDDKIRTKIGRSSYISISAKVEAELVVLSPQEKKEYLETLSLNKSGLDQLIQVGYMALGLITFFTTGEDETRAWTIPKGSFASRAGREIHSDFEEKFIRAEVIQWDKLMEVGSWAQARERGFLRIEGKKYLVQDGDVIEFKI